MRGPSRRTSPAGAPRERLQAEGIACYQTLIRGMLDLTDNIAPGGVLPPPGEVPSTPTGRLLRQRRA